MNLKNIILIKFNVKKLINIKSEKPHNSGGVFSKDVSLVPLTPQTMTKTKKTKEEQRKTLGLTLYTAVEDKDVSL